MSHISAFEEEERIAEAQENTPQAILKNPLHHFYHKSTVKKAGKKCVQHDKKYARRISFQPDVVAGIEEEDFLPDVVEEVCDTWHIYKVTPLFNFQDDDEHLNEVAKILQNFLTSDLRRLDKYEVKIAKIKGLRGTRDDAESVRIQVYQHFNKHTRIVFTGFLVSVGARELQLKSDVTILPVLLASSRDDINDRIIYGLEKCYDCVVSRVRFPSEEMKWMFAMWAGGGNDEKVVLQFKFLKQDVENIRKIELELEASSLRLLWGRVHDETESSFTAQEVEMFHKAFNHHIETTFGIDLKQFELAKFKLPVVGVTNKGDIQFSDKDNLKKILNYLTELCQGNLLSAAPRLAVTEGDAMMI